MNGPIDMPAFAENFDRARSSHYQASTLAVALGRTDAGGREDVVTREVLRAELAELKLKLVREIATFGRDASGRLVTIVAGVATAISATIGASVALLFKTGGI